MFRNPRYLWLAVALAIFISAGSFLNGYMNERDAKEVAQVRAGDEQDAKEAVVDKASTLAQQVTTACRESTGKALADLREAGLCKQAVDTATTIDKATDPDSSTPVTTGPTQAQVNAAVRLFLAGVDLTGKTGEAGKDGKSIAPTAEQMFQAVVSYCATRNQCIGLTGEKGESITGPKGDDAPVITSAVCNAEDKIVLGFDKGDDVVVEDSDCRVGLPPNPVPTEEGTE